jgi:hypothetical protein
MHGQRPPDDPLLWPAAASLTIYNFVSFELIGRLVLSGTERGSVYLFDGRDLPHQLEFGHGWALISEVCPEMAQNHEPGFLLRVDSGLAGALARGGPLPQTSLSFVSTTLWSYPQGATEHYPLRLRKSKKAVDEIEFAGRVTAR